LHPAPSASGRGEYWPNDWKEKLGDVAASVREAINYVDPENLRVTPDCGFGQMAPWASCEAALDG
jgi:methionine synthase II (cobalamin-independent)